MLFKGGTTGAANTGNEPYSEFYAAQVAKKMGLNHVPYTLGKWKGIICSVCELFTSKDYSYIPIGRFVTSGKFPGLCTPDESYHGVTYTERFGIEGAFITKCTVQLMRDLGCIQSPQSAFILNLGLESLPFRMKQHCSNAQKIAEYLKTNEKVAWVKYSGLKDDKYYPPGENQPSRP